MGRASLSFAVISNNHSDILYVESKESDILLVVPIMGFLCDRIE